jgi:hypothetical protein
MQKGINVTHSITTNKMSCPNNFPVVPVSVSQHVLWKLLWMDGYEFGELSVILFMSFACFAPGKEFYTSWSTNIQEVKNMLPQPETRVFKNLLVSSYMKCC